MITQLDNVRRKQKLSSKEQTKVLTVKVTCINFSNLPSKKTKSSHILHTLEQKCIRTHKQSGNTHRAPICFNA